MAPTRLPRALPVASVVAMLTLTATGCQDQSAAPDPADPTPAASSATSPATAPAAPSPSPPPSPVPSGPGSPTASASPGARTVNEAQLRKALLGIKDAPPGFEKLPDDEEGAGRVTSKNARCAPLVRLLNARTLPGSTASAGVAFSGGADGSYVQEDLDAMPSADAAARVVEDYRTAVRSCRSVRLSLPGVGASPVDVARISFAEVGDDSFAARFSATEGDLEGFELIQVASHIGSVVVGTAFVGLLPEDAEAATEDAVDKATDVLGTAGSA